MSAEPSTPETVRAHVVAGREAVRTSERLRATLPVMGRRRAVVLTRFAPLLILALTFAACGGGSNPTGPTAPASPLPDVLVPPVPYSRDDWPHWIDEDGDCQDTRSEVLIRDSQLPVTFRDARGCVVATGRWVDPYSGTVLTDASDVDIDHLVPLENAHNSGGWAWPRSQKQAYANHLGDSEHLLAVYDHVNQSKGSKGPEEWLPPNAAFRCEYAHAWSRIKAAWGLRSTSVEQRALTNACGLAAAPTFP